MLVSRRTLGLAAMFAVLGCSAGDPDESIVCPGGDCAETDSPTAYEPNNSLAKAHLLWPFEQQSAITASLGWSDLQAIADPHDYVDWYSLPAKRTSGKQARAHQVEMYFHRTYEPVRLCAFYPTETPLLACLDGTNTEEARLGIHGCCDVDARSSLVSGDIASLSVIPVADQRLATEVLVRVDWQATTGHVVYELTPTVIDAATDDP